MCHPRISRNALEDKVFGSYLSLSEEDLRISRESLDPGCLTFSWHYLYSIFLMMGYLNSAINPVLYSFRSSEFKKAFKDFIRKKRLFRGAQIRAKNARAISMKRCAVPLHNIPSTDDFGVNLTFYNQFNSTKEISEVNL